MEMNAYMNLTRKTAKYKSTVQSPLSYLTLGLTGEAGEIANKVKKILRDDGGSLTKEKTEKLLEECGDVMWYLAQLVEYLGSDMETVAKENLEKLQIRYASGEDNRLNGST